MLLALALVFSLQEPREAVLMDVNPITPSLQSAVGQNGDVSAIAFVETNAAGGQELYVRIADGRAVDWGPAMRMDTDMGSNPKSLLQGSVVVENNGVHVFWADERHGNRELYSVHSADGGLTWTPEARVDKGLPVGQGQLVAWDVASAASPGGPSNQVYVAMTVTQLNGNNAVYFSESANDGQSFSPSIHLPTVYAPGDFDVSSVSVDTHGVNRVVYVAWLDNRNGSDDAYFQSSFDGGLTWLPVARRMNPVPGSVSGKVSLSSARLKLQVGWLDDSLGAGRRLMVDRSLDGGVTWLPAPEQVGGYQAGLDDVVDFMCLRNRELPVVVWTDNRSGLEECYVGVWDLTFLQWTEFQLSLGGAKNPLLIGHRAFMAVAWNDLGTPPQLFAQVSRDKGVTWNRSTFDAATTLGAEHSLRMAHNKLYGNFLMSWLADDGGVEHVYAGGFRGNEVLPVGTFQQGSTISFAVEGFPSDETGWDFRILIAGATASAGNARLPLADGRSLGLAVDPLFLRTSTPVGLGALQGVIAADGSGATPATLLPPGLAVGSNLALVAISIDPGGGFGHTTDVVRCTVLP